MERPDDAAIRVHVETFAALRRVLPIAILAGSFGGPLLVAEPSEAMWLSVALFCSSLFVLWTIDGLPLYPAHTFGIEYRFEDRSFVSERRRCVRCESVTEDGTRRRYARQLVVLGIPIHTLAWGSNDFCPGCAALDSGDPSGAETDSSVGQKGATGPTVEPTAGSAGDTTMADSRSDTVERTTRTNAGRDGAGTEVARRVDPYDETTALEVRRAFDED